MALSQLVLTISLLISNNYATNPVSCSQITTNADIWGYSAEGVYLAPYTESLQWIGCWRGQCNFYCNDTGNGLEFGSNSYMRALIGDFQSYSDWPDYYTSCASEANPASVMNSPMDQYSATSLCNQLGYESGYVISETINTCPEAHYDGNEWTSDFVNSAGYGRVFICTTPITSAPTYQPTTNPSSGPTYFDCEDSEDIKHLSWNDIMDYGGDKLPQINYTITTLEEDKTLSINIELDYLGYSFIDNIYGFGTSYHLGFYSFDGSSIISNCDNRLASSYKNKTWTEYWEYSETPFVNNSIGSNDYLAYPPPSKYWTIKMKNRCSKLQYSGTFTWDDLSKCQSDDNETMAVDVDIDDKFINMSGIFFVDVLSPLSMVTDVGHYYTYELLSYPFVISIKKSIEFLSATNTLLFTISVIKVGKNNDENIFKMIILTESAVHIPLTNPTLLTSPNNNENSFTFIDNETECLLLSSHICSQIWEMTAIVDCPYTFSGDYGFQFNAVCDSSDESSKCENYTNVYGDTVSLSTGIVFQDDICDEIIWQIEYEAEAIFYNNNTFLTPISYDYQFTVGEDRVYVEIVVDDVYIDNTGYSVINTKLLNVWLCTITNKGQLTLDQNNLTNSGCFSSDIDSDGPYHIIVNYNESFTNGAQHESDSFSNIVRFSFIVPDTITSDVLYIQTQLGLEFVGENNGRRLLLEEQQANQIFHHFKGANVVESEEFDVDTNAQTGGKGKGNNQTISMIMAIIGALFCGLLISCVCFVVYKRKHSGESKHNYGNVVSEQAVVDEIQNNDNCQQSIIEHEETLENV